MKNALARARSSKSLCDCCSQAEATRKPQICCASMAQRCGVNLFKPRPNADVLIKPRTIRFTDASPCSAALAHAWLPLVYRKSPPGAYDRFGEVRNRGRRARRLFGCSQPLLRVRPYTDAVAAPIFSTPPRQTGLYPPFELCGEAATSRCLPAGSEGRG